MLKKRIIPCLDIQEGEVVKGVHFKDMQMAGDPILLAQRYVQAGADELVFLDISATLEGRKTFIKGVHEIASVINIPFTVGGGISTLSDAQVLIRAGADKISINSAALAQPNLITEIAQTLGSQCVVLAIDIQKIADEWWVFSHGGKRKTIWKALEWAIAGVNLGAGEILLTSMSHDGTKKGFAIDITKKISESVSVPVIASGGAGEPSHFYDIFTQTQATGALAASIFHYNQVLIPELKQYLQQHHIPIR